MIKKLSLFFSAIAIGILTIFGSISTKNAAEPQYFLQNTQVKNAIVNDGNYVYSFYLDNNISIDQITNEVNFAYEDAFGYEPPDIEIYYYNEQNELINSNLGQLLRNSFDYAFINFYIDMTSDNNNDITQASFTVANIDENDYYTTLTFVERTSIRNYWFGNIYNTNLEVIDSIEIKGFKVIGALPYGTEFIEEMNTTFTPIIGDQTSLSPIEHTPPLEQINTLVSDIVNWFTNIFNGLGNVFYDPTTNKLTAWGTVMFIGVAIMLISMALKWVISLIRGV